MDKEARILASLRDISLRLDRMHSDLGRLSQQNVPDRFVPFQEATRYLHCGRDWLVAQIRGGVLRPGIDFVVRSSSASDRKRYLVNPVSALRWLNGSQTVAVRSKQKAKPPS